MKIILTEKEMLGLKKVWNNTKDICSNNEDKDSFNSIEERLANKEVLINANGERIIEFEEQNIVEGLLASAYILEETKDASKDLDRAYRMMKGKWTEVGLKIASFTMKTFILKNSITRNFYNALSYYIASFKDAYDKTLTTSFDLEVKESNKEVEE